jgi:hypothetical protein
MKTSQSVVLLSGLLVSAAALSATEPAAWPAGAQDKQDPQVLAFYEAQCNKWADGQGLSAEQRGTYLQQCRVNAAMVYPVGYDLKSGGGGE